MNGVRSDVGCQPRPTAVDADFGDRSQRGDTVEISEPVRRRAPARSVEALSPWRGSKKRCAVRVLAPVPRACCRAVQARPGAREGDQGRERFTRHVPSKILDARLYRRRLTLARVWEASRAGRLVVSAPDADRAVRMIDAARATRVEPAAMELVSPALAASLELPRAWAVAFRLHGNPAAVDEARGRVQAAGRAAGVELISEAERHAVWDRLLDMEARAEMSVRIAQRPADLRATLDLAASLPAAGGEPLWAAHAGEGILRVLVPSAAAVAPDHWSQEVARLRQRLAAGRGTAVAWARGRGPPLPLGLDRAKPTRVARLCVDIKRAFDPAGILPPPATEV